MNAIMVQHHATNCYVAINLDLMELKLIISSTNLTNQFARVKILSAEVQHCHDDLFLEVLSIEPKFHHLCFAQLMPHGQCLNFSQQFCFSSWMLSTTNHLVFSFGFALKLLSHIDLLSPGISGRSLLCQFFPNLILVRQQLLSSSFLMECLLYDYLFCCP